MSSAPAVAAALWSLFLVACDSGRGATPPSQTAAATSVSAVASAAPAGAASAQPADIGSGLPTPASNSDIAALRHAPAPRVVAIGDLHGDLAATRSALRLAGAVDEADHWNGGALVVVQTGDEIDRGDDDRAILDLFERLADEAKAAGGAVHALLGNHELMNAQGDFRYVTDGGFRGFVGVVGAPVLADPRFGRWPEPYRPRAAALLAGGPYAKKLAARHVIAIVGDTVFVHGGVLPRHVAAGLGRVDAEVRRWLLEGQGPPPAAIADDQSLVWTRRYSDDPGPDDCAALRQALDALGAKRMVVGHTVQKGGISSACEGRIWRIDVGMSRHYGGSVQVLELKDGQARPLRAR